MSQVLRGKGSHEAAGRSAQRKKSGDQGGLAADLANSPAMVAQRQRLDRLFGPAIQRIEDEEPLQGKFTVAQAKHELGEEEFLPGRFGTAQRVEEEEPLQGKFEAASPAQRTEENAKPNNTGLPDNLKSGIESLSGLSMDNVRVHYNSSQPTQLNAHAYAQGTDIHVAPGQERHLPHEAWHVVQQAQGRVQPTMQMKEGVPVNDDRSLEHEADVMGSNAATLQRNNQEGQYPRPNQLLTGAVTQRMISINNWHNVYAPQTVVVNDRFGASLNTLMGNAYAIQQLDWAALKDLIWPNGPEKHAPLEGVHNKFQHPRKVHVYSNAYAAQVDQETGTRNLLLPADMSEVGDQLPHIMNFGSACVIQSLVDFGVAAPGGVATDQSWHNWARGQNLDYRTDSDIIRIYVGELGYRLVNNKTVTLNAVNWGSLGGDGNYLVASYVGMPAGVGHMIGLVINGGVIQTIHDRQAITSPTLGHNPGGVSARYIYKM